MSKKKKRFYVSELLSWEVYGGCLLILQWISVEIGCSELIHNGSHGKFGLLWVDSWWWQLIHDSGGHVGEKTLGCDYCGGCLL